MSHGIRKVAVLGAGTMGAAIAAHCANAGLEVDLLDIAPDDDDNDAVVEAGFERMQNARPAALMGENVAGRIRTGNFEDDFDRVGEADWIVEAIIEKLEPKRELMQRVEDTAKESAIISTNTSGIPLHSISEGRSEDFERRFVGTHFFNPPRYLEAHGDHTYGEDGPRDRGVHKELRGARARQGRRHRQGYPELYREPPRDLRRDAVGTLRFRERVRHRRGRCNHGAAHRPPQDRHVPPQRPGRPRHRRRRGREPLRGRPRRRVARGAQAPREARGDAREGSARQQDRGAVSTSGTSARERPSSTSSISRPSSTIPSRTPRSPSPKRRNNRATSPRGCGSSSTRPTRTGTPATSGTRYYRTWRTRHVGCRRSPTPWKTRTTPWSGASPTRQDPSAPGTCSAFARP